MFHLYFILAIGIILGAFFVCKYALKINSEKFDKVSSIVLKTIVVCYCVFNLLTILLPDALNLCYSQEEVNGGSEYKWLAILKWFSCVAFIILPLAVFFKNRVIKNIAIYIVPIISILQLVFYAQLLEVWTSTAGRGLNSLAIASEAFKAFLINPTFRSIVFAIIVGLELIIPVVLAVQEKHVIAIKNWKEVVWTFVVFGFVLMSCVPISVPQHLFGYTNWIFDAWTLPHILWIIFVVFEIVVLYFIFRKKDSETKRIMLFILSLSLLLQYNQMFGAISINIERLPFQLCNVGSYLILLALITKSKKLFDFTVIVNVVGVLFALAMPDLDGKGIFYLYNMHFIFEHTNVIVVPILALLLREYGRLDKKSLLNFFLGFLIYFVLVFILGTIFNGVQAKTGNNFWHANYLFMFDQETAAGFIPFLGSLFDINFSIGIFTFYPIMLLVVYVVFNIICFVVFFTIQLIYLIRNKIINKEKEKIIKLEE